MGKKNENDLATVVDELIRDVGDDRDRLVEFLDTLISNHQGERAAGIAELVAKLADALTKQNQVKVATLKAISKVSSEDEDDDEDDYSRDIGPAFLGDRDEGSN